MGVERLHLGFPPKKVGTPGLSDTSGFPPTTPYP
jgi:hypothetical protein